MDLREYLDAIRKRWWLVVGAVVTALGAAMLVTNLTPPQYAASVTFFVSTQARGGVTDAYQGDLFSKQRVKSYVDLLSSDRLASMVVTNTATGLTADQVRARISAKAVPDTVLLRATVTDGNRARALVLTEALAVEFAALVKDIETPPTAQVVPGVDMPTTPQTAAVRAEVIAGPRLASAPVAPTPTRNAGLAVVLGLLVGVGAAALREAMDTTVKTGAALAELTGSPMLGAVPFDARAKKAPLIVEGSAHSGRAEALRRVRTNLRFVNVDHPVKSMVVTSAVPGEGKSTTACNLAIVLAEAGQRVVLIDADLRRPRVAEYLGLEGAVGLTDVLAGDATLDLAVQQWGKTGVFVLPSGTVPPNPSELLGSRNMAELLQTLRSAFDAVIIDTPPLLPVTDAAVLSSVVDGTVLVSRCGKTTAPNARAAAAALEAVDARVLGCILNMAPGRSADAYRYYEYRPLATAKHSRPAPAEAPATRPTLGPTTAEFSRAEAGAGSGSGSGSERLVPPGRTGDVGVPTPNAAPEPRVTASK